MQAMMHQSFSSPSFNSYSSNNLADIAANVTKEEEKEEEEEEEEFPKDQKSSGARHRNSNDEKTQQQKSPQNEEAADNKDDDDDDFEFAVVGRDSNSSPKSAGEIFYNGQIRPVFPIFNRDLLLPDDVDSIKPSSLRLSLRNLMIEERNNDNPPSSSSSDELEGVPAGTYCVWKPNSVQASPERCEKSNSTGSSKRWKFRDLLPRSNSDGKDNYVFLSPSKTMKKRNDKTEKAADRATEADQKADQQQQQQQHPKEMRKSISNLNYNSTSPLANVSAKGKVKAAKGGVSSGGDTTVSAHEIHYVRNRAQKEEDRRRSYLPYRQDLVGFFANVNGLSRSINPF